MKIRKSQGKKRKRKRSYKKINIHVIHPFKIFQKTYQLFGGKAELPQLSKEHPQKSMPNIILDGARPSAFRLRLGARQGFPFSPLQAGFLTISRRC